MRCAFQWRVFARYMSIQIEKLLKVYGTQKAVNSISFEAPKGVITGFLGPNGAGKSTTMKIANGYLSPTGGRVLVEGLDVQQHALKVRQITGYLPENNPLYPDMYVHEFLRFVGRAYGLRGKQLNQRVTEMIELVGLKREQSKKIRSLSKGYKQRVGLAQALVGDPSVLILDEPTSGLDPNQLLEIREVIKRVSREKTVILSTHIMQEVEAICDKVVIINRGNVVVDENLSSLKSRLSSSSGFTVKFDQDINAQLFADAGIEVKEQGQGQYVILSEDPDLRSRIMKVISGHELPLTSLAPITDSLEQIFQQLTGEQA